MRALNSGFEETAVENNLPTLDILPVENIFPHEYYDEQRARPLMEKLRTAGVLKNPPIVMPFCDGSHRYMILDGTNRVTAVRLLGIPHIIVQVVEPNAPGLALRTWNHVVWGLTPENLLLGLQETVPRLRPSVSLALSVAALHERKLMLVVSLPDGRVFSAPPEDDEIATIATLNAAVQSYQRRAALDRTNEHDAQVLKALYPDISGVVIFPPFKVKQVQRLVSEGHLLPPGITRFIVSPRALRVNYSLEALAAPISLEEKRAQLRAWLQERLAAKGVRYYAEATVLYDD
ncbi:MAG TPA: hypothetical protein ENJ54_08310 [Chloroflexi bacterium]|nr:hypothetical protein [Chloroflexota bacterium]